MIGELGHIAIITAFVASLVSCISYGLSLGSFGDAKIRWSTLGRNSYVVQFLSIALTLTLLFALIFNHDYEYFYAWRHSSNDLPYYYVISSFWEGQEGSFLVWIFWNALVGLILLKFAGKWEPSLFMIIGFIQIILISMILGIYPINATNIGISPFQLLRDVSDNAIFKIDPNFVPMDGNGLNPLLQNLWMVIHPPMIFLGFAISLIPFSYCISGLLMKDMSWVKPAQIWMLVSLGVLSIGIVMGAYWAYETLNFGGYWNWDPVENAILIPWIVMLAATHGLILYQKRGKGLLMSICLILSSYFLIVYSTFLTRSGILGDSSVHSFTDLGLSGQLLVLLGAVAMIITVSLIYSWSFIKSKLKPSAENQFDFLMIIGICVLLLSAFQILLPTSIPVFNKTFGFFGIESNAAPPTDPVAFYSKFQIWFAIGFSTLAAVTQVAYWKKIKGFSEFEKVFTGPLILSLLFGGALLLKVGYSDWKYIVLILVTLLGVFISIQIIYSFVKQHLKVSGGAFSHIGFMIMLLGIVLSAGYSKVVTQNVSINAPQSNLPIHTVQENALLTRNKTVELQGYRIKYSNKYLESTQGIKLNSSFLEPTNREDYKIVRSSSGLVKGDKLYYGDTLMVNSENSYYELEIQDDNGEYHMFPRMQNNPEMGYIASPSILSFWDKDVYIHVTNFPDPAKQQWEKTDIYELNPEESIELFGLKIEFTGSHLDNVNSEASQLLINCDFLVDDGGYTYSLRPIYGIKNGRVQIFPASCEALGIKVLVENINPKTGSVQFRLLYSQRDWITIKAIEMPFISLVWIGIIIMAFGVLISIVAKVKVPSLKVSRGNGTTNQSEKWETGMVYFVSNKKMK